MTVILKIDLHFFCESSVCEKTVTSETTNHNPNDSRAIMNGQTPTTTLIDGAVPPQGSAQTPTGKTHGFVGLNRNTSEVTQVHGCLVDDQGVCICDRLFNLDNPEFIPQWVDLKVKITIETPNGPTECTDNALKEKVRDAMANMRRLQISKHYALNSPPRTVALLVADIQREDSKTNVELAFVNICYVSTKTGEGKCDQMLDPDHKEFISPLDGAALAAVKPIVWVLSGNEMLRMPEDADGYDRVLNKLRKKREEACIKYMERCLLQAAPSSSSSSSSLDIKQMVQDAVNLMVAKDSK